jgi:hypothetical protein
MAMEEMGFGGWGFLIVLILFIWMIFGWNRGGCGNNYNCNAVSNCQVEKQEIIDAARTQYLIEQTSRITQEQTAAGLTALGNKVDFYEYQGLRDQLAAERNKNMVLENRIYSDAQFNALRAQIEEIGCSMLKRPEVTGVGAVCPNAGIINGLGIGSGLNYGGCGGYGGFVAA